MREDVRLAGLSFLGVGVCGSLREGRRELGSGSMVTTLIKRRGSLRMSRRLGGFSRSGRVQPVSAFRMMSTSSDRRSTMLLSGGNTDFILRKPPKANGSRAVAGVVTRTVTSNGGILFMSRGVTTLRIICGHLSDMNLTSFYFALRDRGTGGGRVLESLTGSVGVSHAHMERRTLTRLSLLREGEVLLGGCRRRLRAPASDLGVSVFSIGNELTGLGCTPSIVFTVSGPSGMAARILGSGVCLLGRLSGAVNGQDRSCTDGI